MSESHPIYLLDHLYRLVSISLRIDESPGSHEWLINMTIPNHLTHGVFDCPSHDMISTFHDLPGMTVYDEITLRASEIMGCRESDLFVLFEKKCFGCETLPIHDLGFFNCCTVNVELRDEWRLYLNLPTPLPRGHPLNEHPILVDAFDSCYDVNARVLDVASNVLNCSRDDLYVLFNGTPLQRSQRVEIYKLGLHDGSTLSVFFRLRGGVCIAQNSSGRKRSVSAFCMSLYLCIFHYLLLLRKLNIASFVSSAVSIKEAEEQVE